MNPSPSTKKTSLYVWGNHHISDRNGFQDIFRQTAISQTTEFSPPDFNIDLTITSAAIARLELNLKPSPSVLILVFGDANLLNLGSLVSFLKSFDKVYKALSFNPNYRVITCGVIPPRIVPEHRNLVNLKPFDHHLRKIQQSYGGIFVPLLNQFEYEDYETADRLNYRGNLKLAKIITDVLISLERK
jgi:hypothetical protein